MKKKLLVKALSIALCLLLTLPTFACNGLISSSTNCEHNYNAVCSNTCTKCGNIRTDGEAHTFDASITCQDVTCSVCSAIVKQDHTWTVDDIHTANLLNGGYTDKTCSKCHAEDTELLPAVDPTTLSMPIVYIEDMPSATIPLVDLEKADGEIKVKYKYVDNGNGTNDFEGFSSIKVQGATSAEYAKKNFTVKLYSDENLSTKLKVNLGWGNENKYCMKANFIDASQARNVVSAKLFAQVVASRTNINEGLQNAPNYGVIDGYPVLTYVNGSFHGLYTMNIPKDEWQFGMEGDETTKEGLLMADSWATPQKSNSIRLINTIDGEYEDYGWEVEYCSTADDSWMKDSMNALITLLNCGDGARIKAELPNHLDIEAAIDNFIFTYFINGHDNVAKNILWATYDGNVWIPSMYDMDSTFGIVWTGELSPYFMQPYKNDKIHSNAFYEALLNYYTAEVKARYNALRQGALSNQNVTSTFDAFFDLIDQMAYESDFAKWEVPGKTTNVTNMYLAATTQLYNLDNYFNNLY